MNRLLRWILIGLCVALGGAVAVHVADRTDPPPAPPRGDIAATAQACPPASPSHSPILRRGPRLGNDPGGHARRDPPSRATARRTVPSARPVARKPAHPPGDAPPGIDLAPELTLIAAQRQPPRTSPLRATTAQEETASPRSQAPPPVTQPATVQPELVQLASAGNPSALRVAQATTNEEPSPPPIDNAASPAVDATPAPSPVPAASAVPVGQPEPAARPALTEQPAGAARPAAEELPAPRPPVIAGEGDDHLTVYIQDQDIREVLAALSEQGGLNILASKNVTGKVSASLYDVDLETALAAILRSTGYLARREGKFIYVGTPLDFQLQAQAQDTIGTRIYRPNYITAAELKKLITPLLSKDVGKTETTTPAKTKIPNDATDAEGDGFAGADAVLVQDYESILHQVDQVVAEVDRRPVQVAIEAIILSVKLDDSHEMGVDFQFLRDQGNIRLATGTPAADLAEVKFEDGGLKFGFLDSNLGAFLDALESVGDTNVISTPRLLVLNKHRVEILIGAQLGYVSTTVTETSSSQTVEFLEVGAQLRLRPFVSADGMIRMEIHPELSTGNVRIEGGFTLPDKEVTQVTTNIMVPDGNTVVLGGLMREDLTTSTTQVPLLGSLPWVGPLFRRNDETLERREILIVVTPRIVHDTEACREGRQGVSEFHRRQAVYADQMSHTGKRHLGRKYFRMAQEAWSVGDAQTALEYAELAIHLDPLNRAAIDLRADVVAGSHHGDHSSPPGLLASPDECDVQTEVPELQEWPLETIDTPAAEAADPPLDYRDDREPEPTEPARRGTRR